MPPDDLFQAGGSSGRLMAGLDWAATPLGPVDCWPQSLRAAVRIVLSSRYPGGPLVPVHLDVLGLRPDQ